MLHPNPVNGLIGHVAIEVVVWIAVGRFNRSSILYNRWRPLAGVTTDKTVEVLEAKSNRPEIKRTGLAGVPVRDVVVLTKPGRVVTIQLEDVAESALGLRDQRVVSGIADPYLHDASCGDAVVVSARKKSRSRGRAESGGMKVVVSKSSFGNSIHRRCWDWTTKRTARTESNVISQDYKYVRCAFWRFYLLGEILL